MSRGGNNQSTGGAGSGPGRDGEGGGKGPGDSGSSGGTGPGRQGGDGPTGTRPSKRARRFWFGFDLLRASALIATGVLLMAAGIPW